MAEVKISALSSATTPLAGTELVPIVQGGVTKKVAASNFGASVNSTSGVIPYNLNGAFANSGFSYDTSIDKLFHKDAFGGTNIKIDASTNDTQFGSGYASGGIAYSSYGIAVSSNMLSLGCSMASPVDGVFQANGATGFIRMGASDTNSIGINTSLNSFRIGSGLTTTGTHVTIAKWLKVNTESGTAYYIPLYS